MKLTEQEHQNIIDTDWQLQQIETEAYDAHCVASTMLSPKITDAEFQNYSEELRNAIRRIEYRLKKIKEIRKRK